MFSQTRAPACRGDRITRELTIAVGRAMADLRRIFASLSTSRRRVQRTLEALTEIERRRGRVFVTDGSTTVPILGQLNAGQIFDEGGLVIVEQQVNHPNEVRELVRLLNHLPHLREADFSGDGLNNHSVMALTSLCDLERLTLRSVAISPQAVSQLTFEMPRTTIVIA